jgi:hypothetical protein
MADVLDAKRARRGWWLPPIGCAISLLLAGGAQAQVDLFSPQALHGVVDLRLAVADGETSFMAGGFGKTRYGGGADGDYRGNPQVALAALEWTPRVNWEWSAVVDVTAQPGQTHAIDIGQAYVVFKPVPRSATRFTARAGYFYPPISLEHDAPVWGITNTITPSAINSWVGEEVKVLGVEAGVSHAFGDQSLSATVGVFGWDDTAGTLLTYRGWALHDLKSTARGAFDLPPMSAFGRAVQYAETDSAKEIDHRAGYYGRVEWRPSGDVALDAVYFNNAGDKVGVTPDLQWAWKTWFTDVGADVRLREGTHLKAQALAGRTLMGFETGDGLFADVVFRSAYGLLSQDFGKSTVTGRLDVFDVHDHSLRSIDNNDEHGWALTAAWRRPISKHADVRLEALHVRSVRPSRAYGGAKAEQAQTVLQSSLRLTF